MVAHDDASGAYEIAQTGGQSMNYRIWVCLLFNLLLLLVMIGRYLVAARRRKGDTSLHSVLQLALLAFSVDLIWYLAALLVLLFAGLAPNDPNGPIYGRIIASTIGLPFGIAKLVNWLPALPAPLAFWSYDIYAFLIFGGVLYLLALAASMLGASRKT